VLTAYENVEYPLWIDGRGRAERKRRTEEALASVGLAGRMHQRPDQLSGGERQRVALARGLVHDPLVILADEPTANLDSSTGAEIVDLLARTNSERGTTFLIATHDPAIIDRSPRRVRLLDGRVVADEIAGSSRAGGA
jgi:putative ABC transport system ATP-binding protein